MNSALGPYFLGVHARGVGLRPLCVSLARASARLSLISRGATPLSLAKMVAVVEMLASGGAIVRGVCAALPLHLLPEEATLFRALFDIVDVRRPGVLGDSTKRRVAFFSRRCQFYLLCSASGCVVGRAFSFAP